MTENVDGRKHQILAEKFLDLGNYATLTLFFPQILPEANGLDCARFVITVTHRFS